MDAQRLFGNPRFILLDMSLGPNAYQWSYRVGKTFGDSVFSAMVVMSADECPVGMKFSCVVSVDSMDGDCVFGTDVSSGAKIAFTHVGVCSESKVTLYDVQRSNELLNGAWKLTLDPSYPPMVHVPKNKNDFGFFHDVCCGLGGFSSAFDFMYSACGLPGKGVSAVDLNRLAVEAFALNHSACVQVGDIAQTSVVFQMHCDQTAASCHPLITCGFPCQPLSRQGSQKRHLDERSQVLPAVLQAGFLLQCSGLILECVPEAMTDRSTQQAIHDFTQLMGFQVHQRILHLHHIWPSKRSRWYAVLVPVDFDFRDFPCIHPQPSVGDLIPFTHWPVWSREDEEQLRWTPMEMQTYKDPTYGNPDRRIDLQKPLPTALHSWGNALFACPCECRNQGLNPSTLQAKGLRGVEILSGAWPHQSRHIHPRELQLLLGFNPMHTILQDMRAQLCLFGNSVSPLPVVWILSQLFQSLKMLDLDLSPNALLGRYMQTILQHRDVTWPSPITGTGTAVLDFGHSTCQISFHTNQTIEDMIRAESSLQQNPKQYEVRCEGIELPPWAFVQERTYQIIIRHSLNEFDACPVPVFIDFLGHRHFVCVPATFKVRMLIAWFGVHDFAAIVDEEQRPVQLNSHVFPWQIVVIQLCAADLEFELALRIDGFGSESLPGPTGLQVTASWGETGMSDIDHMIKSNLLVSWAGTGFKHVVVWLPSFAAAVVECWPGDIEDSLRSWLAVPTTRIFAIVFESAGWNLVKIEVTKSHTIITFFETAAQVSGYAFGLAARAHMTGERDQLTEHYLERSAAFGAVGSLDRIFALLDFELGLPAHLLADLQKTRLLPTNPWCLGSYFECNPWERLPQQLPQSQACSATSALGLTGKFLLDFTHAWVHNVPLTLQAEHINVVCIGQDCDIDSRLAVKPFSASDPPLAIFVLTNKHWTLLSCSLKDGCLQVTQYDGLAHTRLSQLAPLVVSLKKAWKVDKVALHSTWIFPQTREGSCGTIALAHFGFLFGLLTEDQGKQFETLHDSLALCSSLSNVRCPVGYGADEAAIIEALEQILPSHGVPPTEVKTRALAAIKVFGIPAIARAVAAKNQWMALKQLGNSKPRPFMWVTHEELQNHIRDRSHSQFGAQLDSKKGKRAKDPKKAINVDQLDPASLTLPAGLFSTNDNTPLSQIQISDVQKNARGIAFGTFQDVKPFLAEAKFISPEGLAVLVVGKFPENIPPGLPSHSLRVPAVYSGTNEPILIDVVSIQLGDQAVYRQQNLNAPEVAVFPTKVLRAHVYKDLWSISNDWDAFAAHPIRMLVQSFPLLKLCRQGDCDQTCGLFHPAIEETGVESGLIDVWAFRWSKLDGSKSVPGKADTMSVFLRIPESSFNALHGASGTDGVFFEPRNPDAPGSDQTYSMIWLPQASFQEVSHKVKTYDHCIAISRLGSKYGIRCLSRHHEELHKELKPQVPFFECQVKEIYRLEPLPSGTQRQSLAETLKFAAWKARPLQPCRGAQGKAWTVGAEGPPPGPFIEAAHGWISVTKVKDHSVALQTQQLIATAKTKQHIGKATASPASGSSDPWLQPKEDPWANWEGPRPSDSRPKVNAPASSHVQTKIDDVEQRLQEQIKQTLEKEISAAGSDDRLTLVEQQIQSIVQNQTQIEKHVAEGGHHIQALQQNCNHLHQVVEQCNAQVAEQGKALHSVATDVAGCSQAITAQGQSLHKVSVEVSSLQEGLKSSLEAYFSKQTNDIEAMLAKRSRTA